jgi:hypothetical protein
MRRPDHRTVSLVTEYAAWLASAVWYGLCAHGLVVTACVPLLLWGRHLSRRLRKN